MPTTSIPSAVAFPEDDGTGTPDGSEDYNSAGYLGLIAQNVGTEHLGNGLQLANPDATNDQVDLTAGHAFIAMPSGVTVQEGSQSTYNATVPSGSEPMYVVVLPSDLVDVVMETDVVNDVYLAVDPQNNDAVRLEYGSGISAPTDPSIYLGTFDSAGGAVSNDAPTAPIEVDDMQADSVGRAQIQPDAVGTAEVDRNTDMDWIAQQTFDSVNIGELLSMAGDSHIRGFTAPPSGAGMNNFITWEQQQLVLAPTHDNVTYVSGDWTDGNAFDLKGGTPITGLDPANSPHVVEIVRGSGSVGDFTYPKVVGFVTTFDVNNIDAVEVDYSNDGGSTWTQDFRDDNPSSPEGGGVVYVHSLSGANAGDTNGIRIRIENSVSGTTVGVRTAFVYGPNEPPHIRYLMHRDPQQYGDEQTGFLSRVPFNGNPASGLDWVGGNIRSSDPITPSTGEYRVWQSDGTGSGNDGELMASTTDSSGVTDTTPIQNLRDMGSIDILASTTYSVTGLDFRPSMVEFTLPINQGPNTDAAGAGSGVGNMSGTMHGIAKDDGTRQALFSGQNANNSNISAHVADNTRVIAVRYDDNSGTNLGHLYGDVTAWNADGFDVTISEYVQDEVVNWVAYR